MRALGWSLLAVLPWSGALDSPQLPLRPAACDVALDVRTQVVVRWGRLEWLAFRRQVEDAWSARGVGICWEIDGRVCDAFSVHLAVTIAESWDTPALPAAPVVVAEIAFDGDVPRTEIRLSLAGGRFIVARTMLGGRRTEDLPAGIAEHLLPIVMGHALAHEIGHFLFRSKAHTRTGLMAAAFRPGDVTLAAFGSKDHGPRTAALAARPGGCIAR
jgi:hypothetical protein